MGNTTPSEKQTTSPVEALAREKPTQLMAQLRACWPLVQEALKAGHTLRLIHERLNLAGLPISYKRLSSYRGRIERKKKTLSGPNVSVPARLTGSAPPTFDVLSNLRAQEQKKVGWQYPSGPPDESKLI